MPFSLVSNYTETPIQPSELWKKWILWYSVKYCNWAWSWHQIQGHSLIAQNETCLYNCYDIIQSFLHLLKQSIKYLKPPFGLRKIFLKLYLEKCCFLITKMFNYFKFISFATHHWKVQIRFQIYYKSILHLHTNFYMNHYTIHFYWFSRSRVRYQNFHLSSIVIFFSAGRIRPTNFTAMAIWSGKGIKKYECPETYFEEYATNFLHSFRNVWPNRK